MIAVVHLVWEPLGPAMLRRFLASYRSHPSGVDHELVVLLNGVRDTERALFRAELEGIEHRVLQLDEPTHDLAAYLKASARLSHDRLCFLNSYSTILADDWLAKLSAALDRSGVGLVGATGSWASARSGALNALRLPNPYKGVIPARRVAHKETDAITGDLRLRREGMLTLQGPPPPRRPSCPLINDRLRTVLQTPEQLLRFPSFPAYHVRTNSFMLDRATFTSLRIGRIRRKMDAYALESGRGSITRQLHMRSLQTLVVDREGSCYVPGRWPHSHTFWQADQERLLIADNQTAVYADGAAARRRLLSAIAWGPYAQPSA